MGVEIIIKISLRANTQYLNDQTFLDANKILIYKVAVTCSVINHKTIIIIISESFLKKIAFFVNRNNKIKHKHYEMRVSQMLFSVYLYNCIVIK